MGEISGSGKIEKAGGIASADKKYADNVLSSVSEGNFSKAIDSANKIKDPSSRSEAYYCIADSLGKLAPFALSSAESLAFSARLLQLQDSIVKSHITEKDKKELVGSINTIKGSLEVGVGDDLARKISTYPKAERNSYHLVEAFLVVKARGNYEKAKDLLGRVPNKFISIRVCLMASFASMISKRRGDNSSEDAAHQFEAAARLAATEPRTSYKFYQDDILRYVEDSAISKERKTYLRSYIQEVL